MPDTDGLLVVDKPAGWTSHDVVARCRRICGTRKVGHAGTLDPMATGVLLIGVGRATRLLGHLALTDKAYDATIRLGQSTVTDDAEGDIVEERDTASVTESRLRGEVAKLTGDLQQVPSAVSAVKVDGQRAYRRVRAGEDVDLAPRAVTVSDFSVQDVRHVGRLLDLDAHVECTTGTYVRALARDLGAALGVGGHLTALRRTRVGPFGVDQARTLEALATDLRLLSLDATAATAFPTCVIGSDAEAAVRNGRPIQVRLGAEGPVAIVTDGGHFLALYEQHGPVAQAVAVFDPA